jgi:hypothetical protein
MEEDDGKNSLIEKAKSIELELLLLLPNTSDADIVI